MNYSNLRLKASVVAVLLTFTPFASADRNTQHRVGVTLNVPIDGNGFLLKDSALGFIYQKARLREGSKVSGYEVVLGSTLNRFEPMGFVAGIAGKRCAYGAVGLGFAKGTWALPIAVQGPFVQAGVLNAGGFGTPFIGASSLDCFDKYEAEVAPTPVPVPVPAPAPAPSGSGSSGSGSSAFNVVNAWMFAGATQVQGFDWS